MKPIIVFVLFVATNLEGTIPVMQIFENTSEGHRKCMTKEVREKETLEKDPELTGRVMTACRPMQIMIRDDGSLDD